MSSNTMQEATTEAVVAIKNWLGDPTSMIDGPMAQALRDLADAIVRTLCAAARAPAAEVDGDEAELEAADPVTRGMLGPNCHRIGYAKNGDMVEWCPDDEAPGGQRPIILRRNDRAIIDAYHEAYDKVWWNHHHDWLESIERGEEQLTCERKQVLEQAMKAAAAKEKKYGTENLIVVDDLEWGELNGRMSALCWVLGTEWEDAGGT